MQVFDPMNLLPCRIFDPEYFAILINIRPDEFLTLIIVLRPLQIYDPDEFTIFSRLIYVLSTISKS